MFPKHGRGPLQVHERVSDGDSHENPVNVQVSAEAACSSHTAEALSSKTHPTEAGYMRMNLRNVKQKSQTPKTRVHEAADVTRPEKASPYTQRAGPSSSSTWA